jgi:hypothetical protein
LSRSQSSAASGAQLGVWVPAAIQLLLLYLPGLLDWKHRPAPQVKDLGRVGLGGGGDGEGDGADFQESGCWIVDERSTACKALTFASSSADVRFRYAIIAAAAPAPTPQDHSSRCSLAAVFAANVIAIVLPAVRTLGAPSTVSARRGKENGAA